MAVDVSKPARKDCRKQAAKNKRFYERLLRLKEEANAAPPKPREQDIAKKGYLAAPGNILEPVWVYYPFGRKNPERIVLLWPDKCDDVFVLRIFSSHDKYEQFLDDHLRHNRPSKPR